MRPFPGFGENSERVLKHDFDDSGKVSGGEDLIHIFISIYDVLFGIRLFTGLLVFFQILKFLFWVIF